MSSFTGYGSQGQGEKIQPRVRLEGFNLSQPTPPAPNTKPPHPPTPQDILSQFTHSSPLPSPFPPSSYPSYPRSYGPGGGAGFDSELFGLGGEVDMDRFEFAAAAAAGQEGGENGVSLSAINQMMINLNHHPSHSHSHSIPTSSGHHHQRGDLNLLSDLAHPAYNPNQPHPSSAPEAIPYSLDSFFTSSHASGLPFPYSHQPNGGVLYQPIGSPISTQGYSTQSGSGVGSLGRQGPTGQVGEGWEYVAPQQQQQQMMDFAGDGRSGRTSLSVSRGTSSEQIGYHPPAGQRSGRSPSSGRRTSFNDSTPTNGRPGSATRSSYPNPQARLLRRSSSSHRANPMSPAGRQALITASPRAGGWGEKYLMPAGKEEGGAGISAQGDSRSPAFPLGGTAVSDGSPGESEGGGGSSSSGARGGREGSELRGMKQEDGGGGGRDWRGEMMGLAQQQGLVGGRVMSTVEEDGVDAEGMDDDGNLPPNSLSKAEDALARKSRRRLSHNEVERRRREVINEKIQELETLLPAPMIANAMAVRDAEDDDDDAGEGGGEGGKKKKSKGKKVKKMTVVPDKLCKGTVLCLTVDLVRQMTHMLEIAQAREQEMASTVRNLRVQMATMASNPSYAYSSNDVATLQMGYLPGEQSQGMDELRTLDEGAGMMQGGRYEERVKDEGSGGRMSVDGDSE